MMSATADLLARFDPAALAGGPDPADDVVLDHLECRWPNSPGTTSGRPGASRIAERAATWTVPRGPDQVPAGEQREADVQQAQHSDSRSARPRR